MLDRRLEDDPVQTRETTRGGTAAMPATWRPQLAVQAAAPPQGQDWIHEIKHDGYRAIAFVQQGQVRFQTRNGHDWTDRYGVLADAFADLPCEAAIIDGEIAVEDDCGVTSLHNLQRALVEGRTEDLTFFAFDLPFLDGQDLRRARLVDRKAALARLLNPRIDCSSTLRYTEHCTGDGVALFARANRLGMEGIVSKRADAPYVHARTPSWAKVKRSESARMAIIGFLSTEPSKVASLILAEEVSGALAYSCRASAGLTADDARQLYAILVPSERNGPAIPAPATRGAHWIAPEWTVEIGFHGRTGLGKPRAPVLLNFMNGASSALTRI